MAKYKKGDEIVIKEYKILIVDICTVNKTLMYSICHYDDLAREYYNIKESFYMDVDYIDSASKLSLKKLFTKL